MAIQDNYSIPQSNAEEVLQKANLSALSILESIADGFVILDKEWRFIYVNPHAEKLVLSKDNVDLLGKNMWDVYPEAIGSIFEQKYHEARDKQEKMSFEAFHPRHDTWYEIHVSPLHEGISIYFNDITRRIYLEAELAKRAQDFQNLAEHVPDVIVRHDRNFRYQYVNPAIEKITGKPAQAFLGKTSREAGLTEEESRFFDAQLSRAFHTGKPESIEYSFYHPQQGEQHYHSSLVPEYNPEGTVASVLVITRDITASKTLEQRKDEFISVASHELRTPITMLKTLTQLLRRKLEKQGLTEPVQSLAKMETQINKLTKLIADLLDVSKIQAGKLDYAAEDVDIDAVVADSIETVQQTSATHAISFHGASNKYVIGDKDKLEQVFINLISNAIKYSPKANKVDVHIATAHNAVVVRIQDYGIGVPKEQQRKIFDRFYRVSNNGTASLPGLGMGLYISRDIITRHGGNITLESEEGKGSTFIVTLPAKEGEN